MEIKDVLCELDSSISGLSQQDVQNRLQQFGPNELVRGKGKSFVKMFLEQFADILMIILLIAVGLSIVSYFITREMGDLYDAFVIIAIVAATAALGFIEEFRSGRAVEALKKMTAPMATVVRNGKETKILAKELVPGDILLLYTGDRVPADARLIDAFNLKTDESALTGESSTVSKRVERISEETPISDQKNVVFTGTAIAYGRGKAAVTSTGMNTEFGRIAQMVQTARQETTPLEKRTASIGKWIGIMAVAICFGVAGIGIAEGRNLLGMILWGVSLAVAAVPEALPAIVTGALAVGMYRMAKVNTVVKKLPAVETLGSTNVICSDKTGTMTKGEMTVQRIFLNGKVMKVTGIGYEPTGVFICENEKVDASDPGFRKLLTIGALCNDSRLEKDLQTEKWVINGDPTEGALIVAAAKMNLWKKDLEQSEPRIDEIPFSSERKLMTTIHATKEDRKIAYMKGAPEEVLKRCSGVFEGERVNALGKDKCADILKTNEALAKQALRNLGFAFKELPEDVETVDETLEKDFVFNGIMGMIDPPREEVKEAIYTCRKAGIDVIMITGDHRLTAIAVARELALFGEGEETGRVLTGEELEEISDERLADLVDDTVVYARVSPEHKVRIVKALKSKGRIVAMTGDGVNDAPALKMADIGVAMGISGTEVTKEAADMILTDDNFASIVKAVKEGREIYDNIKKYLTYLLRCNIMEILVMFIAVVSVPYLASVYSPGAFSADTVGQAAIALTAAQLLWVNLTTDGLPAMALGIDPSDPDIMERKPRDPNESVFTKDVKTYLIAVPIIMTVLLLFGYFYLTPWESPSHLLEARTQLLTAMILLELTNALSARSLRFPVFKVGIFKNKFLWYALLSSFLLQIVVLYTPGLNTVFGVRSPKALDWAFAILFTVITFGALELGKYVGSKRRSNKLSGKT